MFGNIQVAPLFSDVCWQMSPSLEKGRFAYQGPRPKAPWRTIEENEGLQQKIWSPFNPDELGQAFASRMSAHFPCQNGILLK